MKLFHPDKFFDDSAKRETYQKLTQAINHAKDTGDLDTLREIANDPEGYIRKQGWAGVDLSDEKEIKALRRLLEMLQIKIVEVIEATDQLKESPDYELYSLSQRDVSILDTVQTEASGVSAGPPSTFPCGLKREPWQGQSQVASA